MVPCPTGAAPRWISNVGVLKKDMKMDEDLTGKYPYSVGTKCLKIVIAINFFQFPGISEMFKTPVTGRRPRPVAIETSATKTPVADLSKSVIEPSVLNTPEEPGKVFSISTHFKYRCPSILTICTKNK